MAEFEVTRTFKQREVYNLLSDDEEFKEQFKNDAHRMDRLGFHEKYFKYCIYLDPPAIKFGDLPGLLTVRERER